MSNYEVPNVWTTDEEPKKSGNQPTAGSRFEQTLPKGDAALQLYSLGTPNGMKVTILLEELKEAGFSDLDYDLYRINISEGEQFGSEFVEINPNSKIPALMDYSQKPPLRVFESASIMLYLAEKYNKFMPHSLSERTEMMNWLFWQMGSAPFVGGGFGHFYHYAPYPQEYPINRYAMETKRQLDVLNQHLSDKEFMLGEEYTIADMAIWTWYGNLVLGKLYGDAATFLAVESYPNVRRWAEKIAQRPGVKKGLEVTYKPL